MSAGPYLDLDQRLAPLDARSLAYRFDLEREVPWERIAEPGLFLPPDLLADLGVDVAPLQAHPEAWAMFQWAAALQLCEGFLLTERALVDFLAAEDSLLGHPSNVLLRDEELKHIELFRRCADALRDQHPEWSFAYDRWYDRWFGGRGCGLLGSNVLRALPETSRHTHFWYATVYFEELTVYLHDRLRRASDVQPAWLALHGCHSREEVQHLRTDDAHVAALDSSDDERRAAADALASSIVDHLHQAFGLRVAEPMVREAFPEVAWGALPEPKSTRVLQDVVADAAAFPRTRALLDRAQPTTAPTPARARARPRLLEGRRILVTGGSRGLGRALCLAFARAGARVAFSYRSGAEAADQTLEELKRHGEALAFQASVTDRAATAAMLSAIGETWGALDVLVNNAAVNRGRPFVLLEEEDWDQLLEVNVKGTVLTTRAALPLLQRGERSVILNIGSAAGSRMIVAPVHYATTKAAIQGFTQALAKELGRHRIRVNCLAPGVLSGGMGHELPDYLLQDCVDHTSLRRLGTLDEVADCAAFLVSDRNGYMSGETVVLDGGLV